MVVEHDMARGSRRGGNDGFCGICRRRGKIRPTRSIPSFGKALGHATEPIGIGFAVIVRESKDLARRRFGASISRGAQATGGEGNEFDSRKLLPDEVSRAIGGAIVHDHYFEFRLTKMLQ
jgi:hypothetical protein